MGFRMFFKDGEKKISPWHDIPLKSSTGAYNFVCEIPKETDAKMECAIVRLTPSIHSGSVARPVLGGLATPELQV